MSERHPVYTTISRMEVDVADVGRWADVLHCLGAGPHQIDPGAIHVIGIALMQLGKRLDEAWNTAFDQARGQA